jgi:hypothetical protein
MEGGKVKNSIFDELCEGLIQIDQLMTDLDHANGIVEWAELRAELSDRVREVDVFVKRAKSADLSVEEQAYLATRIESLLIHYLKTMAMDRTV